MSTRLFGLFCLCAAAQVHGQALPPGPFADGTLSLPNDFASTRWLNPAAGLSAPVAPDPAAALTGPGTELNLPAGRSLVTGSNFLYTAGGLLPGTLETRLARPATPVAVSLLASTAPTVLGSAVTLRTDYTLRPPLALNPSLSGDTGNLTGGPAHAEKRFTTVVINNHDDPAGSMEISNMSVIFIPTNAPVPEPSSLALGALGWGLAGWLRRRTQG